MVPTHYCLRHTNNNGCVLRNWSLQGKAAEPGADWVQIRRHDNDQTLAKQGHSVGAWPIDGEAMIRKAILPVRYGGCYVGRYNR